MDNREKEIIYDYNRLSIDTYDNKGLIPDKRTKTGYRIKKSYSSCLNCNKSYFADYSLFCSEICFNSYIQKNIIELKENKELFKVLLSYDLIRVIETG